jgi:hypothetical protein
MFTGEPPTQWMRNSSTGKIFRVSAYTLNDGNPNLHKFPYPRLNDTNILLLSPPTSGMELSLNRTGQNITSSPSLPLVTFSSNAPSISDLYTMSVNFTNPQPGATPGPPVAQIGLTDDNYDAHARQLLPKAISYSAGLLNYFFRGKLDVEKIGYVSGPNNSVGIRIQITNLSKDTFSKGSWELYHCHTPLLEYDSFFDGHQSHFPTSQQLQGSVHFFL